jgi:ribosomal-protein-serine acetyltransferase
MQPERPPGGLSNPLGRRARLSERVRLRLLKASDADELFAVIDANRSNLAVFLPWAAGQTLDGTRAFIELTRKQLADDNGFQTAIVKDQRIIGVVGYHGVNWPDRSTTLGYWLAAAERGYGTMTRAAGVLVDHAIGVWGLNRVEIGAAPENTRSRAIAVRLGFRQEGTLRQAERVGGRYLDTVVYSMLAAEWPGLTDRYR